MRFVPLLLLAACATEPNDITGPYTGPTQRFVVDEIHLATTNTQAREFGDDLNGDEEVDNQLGQVLATLMWDDGVITTHGPDMIAAGAIASNVEIVADNFGDSIASVLYRGADGEVSVAVGGRFDAGAFRSNRTATTAVPGSATLHLPVFVDADPTAIELEGMEIDLQADGHGGFNGYIRGVVDAKTMKHAAYLSAAQMLAANPNAHQWFLKTFDKEPYDNRLSEDEFVNSSLIMSLLSPDITFDGRKMLSLGFRVHLSPCASGRCASAPADTCHDRVKEANETDIDCGGDCALKCPDSGH